MAATNKVLNTTELLEAILLELDFTTLLLSQRVSKTFANTITSSPAIQTALFNPAPDPDAIYSNIYWTKILTPQNHHLRITEFASNGDVVFFCGAKIPNPEEPATGSWRNVRVSVKVRPGVSEFRLKARHSRFARCFGPEKEEWTLGEVLDAVLGEWATAEVWTGMPVTGEEGSRRRR